MSEEVILIKYENYFYQFLKNMKNDPLMDSENFILPNICFDGWPILHINVKGEKYHSSVNTNLISGMMTIIEEIQRSYSLIKYGTSNLSKLTNEDKQNLDVIFNIAEGSSDAKSDNSGIINKGLELLKAKMGKMNGWQTMAVLLAFTCAAGHYFYDNNQKEIELSKQNNKTVETVSTAMIEQTKILIEDYESRGKTQVSSEINEHALNARNNLIKQIASDSSVESLKINSESFSKDELLEYTTRQPIEKTKYQVTDTFIIKGLDRTGAYLTDYNIKVIRKSNGELFTIKADEELLSKDELSKISSAWEKNIDIKISYMEVKNKDGQILIGSFIALTN